MLKPTDKFKLSKQTKRMMANIVDAHERGAFKRAMIQAQLQSEIRPKERKKGEPDLD